MKLFAEGDLRHYLESRTSAMETEVRNEPREKLLNVNETQYVDYLVNRYRIEPLMFHWEQLTAHDHEMMIPADRHPNDFMLMRGNGAYPRQVITFHIPFSGDRDLLNFRPSTYVMWHEDITTTRDGISFDVINWKNDIQQVAQRKDEIISFIKQQAQNVDNNVQQFNAQIDNAARATFLGRKQTHLKALNMLQSLGVPVAVATTVPQTFAVPVAKRSVLIKPSAPSTTYVPEPTLDEAVYTQLVKFIHDYGVEMERHPSLYTDKGEEALRDLLIMALAPHFQSSTGETFNKEGKTDILIRHEQKNVFIAECKFWKGTKQYLDTLTQLLGYLTWRDSKAAAIIFVQNKELNPVLEQIESETQKHPCFVKAHGKQTDGWYRFELHLKDDPTRSVKCAVLCFHFPSN